MTAAVHPQSLSTVLRQDLHGLSQPLTRLQWRLELGQRGGESELRETVEGALTDALELMQWLRRIRSRIEQQEAAL